MEMKINSDQLSKVQVNDIMSKFSTKYELYNFMRDEVQCYLPKCKYITLLHMRSLLDKTRKVGVIVILVLILNRYNRG